MIRQRQQRTDGEPASQNSKLEQDHAFSPPSLSLPKGGGAIRGVGEKFAANPVTGTGSLSVPLATSPGRSGFRPELSLSYDSGAGNGPFGFGWHFSLPAITRKTDKGLPQYDDDRESDTFLLSGSEDLVPMLEQVGDAWQTKPERRTVDGIPYLVQKYRPRVEGLFARIERWTAVADGVIHWRSLTPDNITTLYGSDNNSRIVDPADPTPERPTRIFEWLISASYDDKGNAILYRYAQENSDNVDLSQANERNRSRSAKRYIKRILYGNRAPNRDAEGNAIDPRTLSPTDWMFEVVFDYGEHDSDAPTPNDANEWLCRHDPFSQYRSGFEVRTYRLCQRVLMFHHLEDVEDIGRNCLVRSTDLTYRDLRNNADDRQRGHPVASFIGSITQNGYKRKDGGSYLRRGLPPLEFEYSEAVVHEEVIEADAENLENLPYGLDGAKYHWLDLDGEGISGILTEQANAWFYKRNLSPITPDPQNQATTLARFAPPELIALKPSVPLASGQAQFMDLSGDGQLDLVVLDGPEPGFYEHDTGSGWSDFQPFISRLNRDTRDPNLRLVDLDGDGHADVLITEQDVITWYPSLAEEGFGPARRAPKAWDQEKGPALVLADGTQSVYLADMSGDGLSDLVRVRNGQVCYWPNLGYGVFGSKVVMDDAPWFDAPDQFDQARVRLADIDGSGTTDLIYLGRDGVQLYFNQAGNRWSAPHTLRHFPHVDNAAVITPLDLLGNGTACLVWSSPLPNAARRQLRYIDLMGGQKPHLLTTIKNNLGAETRIHYTSSTKFYLQDKYAGNPWITRLPFAVHVVERVETFDWLSRNYFVTRYAYHHGCFDGVEREFRGFGMVEQFDAQEFAALHPTSGFSPSLNVDEASHVPPVYTKSWFHTGTFLDTERISRQFAHEYYREGDASEGQSGLTDESLRDYLLDDTILPTTIYLANGKRQPHDLTAQEIQEACRALKGRILHQEIYALDESDAQDRPYATFERNYTLELLQPQATNRHAVLLAHPREQLDLQYERALVEVNGTLRADPRMSHTLLLEADEFGNVLRSLSIAYRRRALPGVDAPEQLATHMTLTAKRAVNRPSEVDWYRIGVPVETRTFEIVNPPEPLIQDRRIRPFRFQTLFELVADLFPGVKTEPDPAKLWNYENWDWRTNTSHAPSESRLRLLEHVRTLYRKNNLSGLLDLGELESLALPGENYKRALTPGLLSRVFRRAPNGQPSQDLLPNPNAVLEGNEPAQGGYISIDSDWWIPSGRIFFDPAASTPVEELMTARRHFLLPRKFTDPFGHSTTLDYDAFDLAVVRTQDAAGNTIAALYDYRVFQPTQITDPNGNRSQVVYDALGMVAGTAVQGKVTESRGDNLEDFQPDLEQAQLDALYDASEPHSLAPTLLQNASTRIVYDLHRFFHSRQAHPDEPVRWEPPFAATMARESHVSEPLPPDGLKIQISFSYSDGFGREIQKKIQAEPGAVQITDANGSPAVMNTAPNLRWVGSGWTIFNNKGKPVRRYEPFFTATHRFEFGVQVGVSSILFYDPLERVVATLHPNHTYEKVRFDPWQQTTWDVNDTVTLAPQNDPDVQGFFVHADGTPRLATDEYLPTWHALRTDPAHAAEAERRWAFSRIRQAERAAAEKAQAHQNTPTIAHFDSLGRTFLTLAHNGFDASTSPIQFPTRVVLDSEGNAREVMDAQARRIVRYDYDMLGNRIHTASMEAGERWRLDNVTGKPFRGWDSRGHTLRTEYDALRRPLRSFVVGADPDDPVRELVTEQFVYGELHPENLERNLRGTLFMRMDQAGVATTEAHDFKSNPSRTTQRIAQEFKRAIDWSDVAVFLPDNATDALDLGALNAALTPHLEPETYSSRTTYDALNRPLQLIPPYKDAPDARRSVIQPVYNAANLLEQLHIWLDATTEPDGLVSPTLTLPSPVGVNNIDYDAKGQRLSVEYKNGATTRYRYDRETFRLIQLYTRRSDSFTEDCENPHPPPATIAAPPEPTPDLSCGLQNIYYTYDPVGNMTQIFDAAQQTIYFRNQRVEATSDYTYDPLYRLAEATGREHLGQGGSSIPHSHDDALRIQLPHPGDGSALGRYTEHYTYDAVGNFLEMKHEGSDAQMPGWTRRYVYEEPSQIEDGTGGAVPQHSNRLSHTQIGDGAPERYVYDAHGNAVRMPHLSGDYPDPNMEWDYRDQLCQIDRGGGGVGYYTYDNRGTRLRKVIERQNGARQKECIYLGGLELYREYNGNGATVSLERETLHIMDDKQRIALVENRTQGEDALPSQIIRYQFGNHLGSASLELDEHAQIISYEEYTPYGSTSYQAVRSHTETPKRYRFTGKERDEESGLYYHGVRYYAPWLGRWMSCDPAGFADAPNLYLYVRGNPILLNDPIGAESSPVTLSEITIAGQPDARTEEEIAREIEAKTGKKASDYVLELYGPRQMSMHELENELHSRGIIKERVILPDNSKHPVIDEVLEPSPYQDAMAPRYKNRVMIGSEQEVDQAKAEGLQSALQAQQAGLGAAAGAAKGQASEGLVKPRGGAAAGIPKISPALAIPAKSVPSNPTPQPARGGSVGAARANDPEIFTPPGKWESVTRGQSKSMEKQALWSGKEFTFGKGTITVQEYNVKGVRFDRASFDQFGDLKSLDEFKYTYAGSIASGNQGVADSLKAQAKSQISIADELGVPLEWHVKKAEIKAFQQALGPELTKHITFKPY